MTKAKRSSRVGARFILTIPVKTLRIMEKFAAHHGSSVEGIVVNQLSGFTSNGDSAITCEFKK